MDPEILRPDSQDVAPTQAVEFALVLSRMIDSVGNDPEHLRATIYELARYKLKEQFGTESFADARKISKSLEIAIQGVEALSQKKEGTGLALPGPEANREKPRSLFARAPHHDIEPVVQTVYSMIEVEASTAVDSAARKRGSRFKAVWKFAAVFAAALAIGLVATLRPVWFNLPGRSENIVTNQPASILPKAAVPPATSTLADPPLAAPSPVLPSSFGIYAVSENKLYELDVMPGRAPDPRIAISSLITTPSRVTLPDGHLTFIVYRRDSATTAADRAEVRPIARIAREVSFDKNGKQVVSKLDDNWVMRNVSIPYRTAPKKDNPDMYEVQSQNPDTPLAPGRYALVLKGLAYDFSVAGTITDPRQCLERLAATNGQFYSECQKQ